MNLNKAIIAGRLTRDPELKALPSGTSVASFAIATDRIYTKDGQRVEETDFHNVVVFGKQAESCAQFLKKGQLALVEGRMQTRSWESEGRKNYKTEVIADRVQFGPRSAGTPGSAGGAAAAPRKTEAQPAPDHEAVIEYPTAESEGINPEDIPF